jgi:uncharacterized membrane protein YecN with MAPEG domain
MPVSAFFVALLAFFMIFLSFAVIKARRASLQAVGNANGDETLERAVRAHANFTEYTPLFLLMLFLIEYVGYSAAITAILGGGFSVGRCCHAYSLLRYEPENSEIEGMRRYKWRIRGIQLTFIPLGLAAVLLLLHTISQIA